jgi:hypothetical protein
MAENRPGQDPSHSPPIDSARMTYSYVRAAMVGLLVAIGVAVFYQRMQQQEPLQSVSAYYYTSAQAVFVGGLIALGVCMIALRGRNDVEEVALNLGGMFAILVAVVPTSRGPDHESVVAACRAGDATLLTNQVVSGENLCPDVEALEAATRANVENNLIAILALGLIGLISALWLVLRAGRGRATPAFWWGFAGAAVVWSWCLVSRLVSIERFIEYAHHAAAAGLLVGIFAVAVANAVELDRERRKRRAGPVAGKQLGGVAEEVGPTLKEAGRTLVTREHSSRYSYLAWAMVVAGVCGVLALLSQTLLDVDDKVVTLFWVEILVALLFASFWLVQTVDLRKEAAAPAEDT